MPAAPSKSSVKVAVAAAAAGAIVEWLPPAATAAVPPSPVTSRAASSSRPGLSRRDDEDIAFPFVVEEGEMKRRVSSGGSTVWLALPAQSQICSRVPLAELGPVASRHLPESGLTRLPFAPAVHCWAPVPLQSYSCTFVPLAVPAAVTSMHLPSACSVRRVPTVHCCAVVPLQS